MREIEQQALTHHQSKRQAKDRIHQRRHAHGADDHSRAVDIKSSIAITDPLISIPKEPSEGLDEVLRFSDSSPAEHRFRDSGPNALKALQ